MTPKLITVESALTTRSYLTIWQISPHECLKNISRTQHVSHIQLPCQKRGPRCRPYLYPTSNSLSPSLTPVSPQLFSQIFCLRVFSEILRTGSAALKSRGVSIPEATTNQRLVWEWRPSLQYSRKTLLRSFQHDSSEGSPQDCAPVFHSNK